MTDKKEEKKPVNQNVAQKPAKLKQVPQGTQQKVG
jgi:hypothetical protein